MLSPVLLLLGGMTSAWKKTCLVTEGKKMCYEKKQKKAAYFLFQLLNECHLSLQSSSAVAYHVIKDLPIQQGLHATHQTLLLHHQDEDLPSNSVLVLYQLLLFQKTASAADCKNKALWDYFITYKYEIVHHQSNLDTVQYKYCVSLSF